MKSVANSSSSRPATGTATARPLRLLQVLGYAGVSGKRFGITGVERVVEILLEGLPRDRYAHYVAYPRGGELFERYEQRSQVLAIEPQRRWDRAYVARLADWIGRHDIDLVVSHGLRFDFLAQLACRRTQRPHVVVRAVALADEPMPAMHKRLYGLADAWTLRHCRTIVAVSEASARRMIATQRLPESKVVVIPNGVRVPKVAPDTARAARAALGVGPRTLLVGGVGQLIPRKGFELLVEALGRLRGRFDAVVCVLIGEGPERERLQTLANRLGVNLQLLGYRADPYPTMASFDVGVLPSRAEGMPLVILEAMALGVACIATPAAGTVELIESERSGLIVPTDDVAALANALERVLGDAALRARLGAAGATRVRELYGLDAMLERFDATLRRAAGWPA